jgi:hypothetical protein
MMRRLAAIGLGMSCLLLADEGATKSAVIRQRVQVVHTDRMDFPAGGLLRVQSTGGLRIEGWDRADMEITTIKSTKAEYGPSDKAKALEELGQVHIATELKNGEMVVTTTFPHQKVLKPKLPGAWRFDIEYEINVPRNARIAVDHGDGEVLISDVTGDIHSTVWRGGITLNLAAERQYDIDAKSRIGAVVSDFPGTEKTRLWLIGQEFASEPSSGAQKLFLRTGYGDIIIFKIDKPHTSTP